MLETKGSTLVKFQMSKIVVPDGITKIGREAFKGSNIEEVVLPDSVKEIEDSAFENCISLKMIRLPQRIDKWGENIFHGCYNLEYIPFPEGVVSIYNDFETREGSIYIPSTVENIERLNCPLKNVTVSPENKRYCIYDKYLYDKKLSEIVKCCIGNTYVEELIIPDGVKRIASYAFSHGRTNRLILPDSLEEIDVDAFNMTICEFSVSPDNKHFSLLNGILYDKEHTKLIRCPSRYRSDKVIIPASVTQIAKGAFDNCTNVKSLLFSPNGANTGGGIKKLEDESFAHSGIEEIVLPDGLMVIGSYVFPLSELKRITISKDVHEIKEKAFQRSFGLIEINVAPENKFFTSIDGILYNKDCTKLIRCPVKAAKSKIVIPDSVTEIEAHAFEFCYGIKDVYIHDNVKSIGAEAFRVCANLESIRLPEGLPMIRELAFSGCESLKSIEIPDSVTELEFGAFAGCGHLEHVSLTEGLTKIGAACFHSCDNLMDISIPESVSYIDKAAFSEPSVCESGSEPEINEDTDITIHCKAHSYAHQFAVNNDLRYCADK